MIKGLYFKLNMDKARDKIVYNFFNTLDKPDKKVDTLYMLVTSHLTDNEVYELALMDIEKEGPYHG